MSKGFDNLTIFFCVISYFHDKISVSQWVFSKFNLFSCLYKTKNATEAFISISFKGYFLNHDLHKWSYCLKAYLHFVCSYPKLLFCSNHLLDTRASCSVLVVTCMIHIFSTTTITSSASTELGCRWGGWVGMMA